MPKVRVGDINMYYEIHGRGFPLVMIMGAGASKDRWSPNVIKQLSKHFKILIFDNRGVGRTDVPEGKYTVRTMADDVVGLMDALKIAQAHVLGVSLGGVIAQELVLNYPERVNKLVLMSTFCGGPHAIQSPPEFFEKVVRLIDKVSKGEHEEAARVFASWLFSDDYMKNNPDVVEKFVARYLIVPVTQAGIMGQMAAAQSFDTYDRLPQITKPTLIMHGKDDATIPVGNAEILAERIPEAELVIYDNTQHGMLLQVEEDWLKRAIEFLKR
nr:alpha/beta hydrolase [Candidatus Freyarchaeota archaeon]